MMASDVAAISAALMPCAARATTSIWWSTERPPASEVRANNISAATKVRRLPDVVGGPATEHQKAGKEYGVGVDHPLQLGAREIQARLDRREGDVDDREVEDDHELGNATDGQEPSPGLCSPPS